MNDYEKLMQAAEPLRRYLEAHCGLTTEILVSRDRVDVLRVRNPVQPDDTGRRR